MEDGKHTPYLIGFLRNPLSEEDYEKLKNGDASVINEDDIEFLIRKDHAAKYQTFRIDAEVFNKLQKIANLSLAKSIYDFIDYKTRIFIIERGLEQFEIQLCNKAEDVKFLEGEFRTNLALYPEVYSVLKGISDNYGYDFSSLIRALIYMIIEEYGN